MAPTPQSFKRLLLGLQASPRDQALQTAIELADLLDLDLLGFFLDDVSLRHLASMPFAREFRALGGGWQPLDTDRLASELALAARSAERMFMEAAKHRATRRQFEVFRGLAADVVRSMSQAGDIIVILEPASPAERASQQFSSLVDAAFGSAAAFMLFPSQLARTSGAIAAIATRPDDPAIHTAAAIARAAKEELVIIEATPGPALLSDADACAHLFGGLRERLVVMSRDSLSCREVLTVASTRHVPVLAIEPGCSQTAALST